MIKKYPMYPFGIETKGGIYREDIIHEELKDRTSEKGDIIQGEWAKEDYEMPKPSYGKSVEDYEIEIFVKHGADKKLARVMSGLFGPIGYSPVTGTLDQRIQQAEDALEFQELSFAMLLKGDTEGARQYMQRAVELDSTPGRRTILENIDEVQRIITASKDEFDQLRKKYNDRPFEDYLV